MWDFNSDEAPHDLASLITCLENMAIYLTLGTSDPSYMDDLFHDVISSLKGGLLAQHAGQAELVASTFESAITGVMSAATSNSGLRGTELSFSSSVPIRTRPRATAVSSMS